MHLESERPQEEILLPRSPLSCSLLSHSRDQKQIVSPSLRLLAVKWTIKSTLQKAVSALSKMHAKFPSSSRAPNESTYDIINHYYLCYHTFLALPCVSRLPLPTFSFLTFPPGDPASSCPHGVASCRPAFLKPPSGH